MRALSLRRVPATIHQDDRKKALDAAKSAVNAYAKDPSDKNAVRVQAAWGAVKGMETAPFWQQQLDTWLRSDPGPEEDLKRVIQQTLEDARSRGRDYVGQTELAVRAVRQVRPDIFPTGIRRSLSQSGRRPFEGEIGVRLKGALPDSKSLLLLIDNISDKHYPFSLGRPPNRPQVARHTEGSVVQGPWVDAS